MPDLEQIPQLVQAVQSADKYAAIDPGLVKSLVEQEMAKGRNAKETVKAVRNKLHQVGSAYQEKQIDYAQLKIDLEELPHSLDDPQVKEFCLQAMRMHASTQERLGFIDEFYTQVLNGLGPIHSLLDLACGLNPLALGWLPLASDAQVSACDIYADMTEFLNTFYTHFGVNGKAYTCDLIHHLPNQAVQVALLLKTIPCLEQVDKTIGRRLLLSIQAEHLIVSFPVHSLGGRGKGMRQNYDQHFQTIIADLPFEVRRFDFTGELVFRLTRL